MALSNRQLKEIERLWEGIQHQALPDIRINDLFRIMILLDGEPLPNFLRIQLRERIMSFREDDILWLERFAPSGGYLTMSPFYELPTPESE